MKALFLTTAVVLGASAVGAFAQEVTCGDFSLMDKTQKMATIASIDSETSQMSKNTALTPDEIFTKLEADCKDKVDVLVIEIVKGYKGM
ncbi:MAG: hypothetical protein U1E34_01815 [Amaricoccus sp.]